MARTLWVGIDVGVETSRVCVIDDAGNVMHEASCASHAKAVHQEITFLKCRRRARIGLESGIGTAIARGLLKLGYCVEIFEARQLSKFLRARRNKTDSGDALGIAHAGRIGARLVSRVHLKSLECQSLACRLKIRRYFIKARQDAVSLLRKQIELFGGRLQPGQPAHLREKVEAQIKALFGKSLSPHVAELKHLLATAEAFRAHQLLLDRELKQLAMENDVCRRMMDIPGVGPICALAFYAAVSEPHRFKKSSDIGPYLGLTPRVHQSGMVLRSGRISRMGNSAVRTLLVQCSLRFMKCGDPESRLHVWASAIELRRGRGKARVAAARKLAMIMIAMWKNGTSFDPQFTEAT